MLGVIAPYKRRSVYSLPESRHRIFLIGSRNGATVL